MDPNVKRTNSRAIAAETLRRVVEEGAFSQIALSAALDEAKLDARDRGFVTHLVYGTLTFRAGIDRILDHQLKSGLESVAESVRNTMRVAVYELFFAPEAPAQPIVVHEAVEALPERTPKSLRGLTNGVLRNLVRKEKEIRAAVKPNEVLGVESWMLKSLRKVAGKNEAFHILQEWNKPSRTWVRSMLDDGELESHFDKNDVAYDAHPVLPYAFAVQGAVDKLPGHGSKFHVQDPGAQLAGWLCSAEVSVRTVIDACAGLGGKTLHLQEMFPRATVHAMDSDPRKLARIPELDRVEQHEVTFGNDGLPDELKGVADVALVDAPCTALGTIGRHPEVRWRRQKEDVAKLAAIQRAILGDVAQSVKVGGLLIYAVCTWSKKETNDVVDWFMDTHHNFELEPFSALDGVEAVSGMLRTWPTEYPTDGFFYARFRRFKE